jgi:SIR2-like domain
MDDLIEYINSGSCVLFLGAGASRSAGLPDWPVLAGLVAEDFRANPKLDQKKVTASLAARNFPHLFGDISRTCGETALLESCSKHLHWNPDQPLPRLYSWLLNWRFQAFFTTNFDDLIRIGLTQRKLAATVHSNSRADLALVDIDTVLTIVKLHGDLFPVQSRSEQDQKIILTDDDYLKAEVSDQLQYLRDFLTTYLRSKRIIFVGYSFSDPDIQLVLKQVAVNLRRSIPLYAILADISDDKVDELHRNFNIRVVPYQNRSGTHKELLNLIEALDDYVLPRDTPSPNPVDPINLKRAQALYFWHKLQLRDDVSVHVDAIKSLLLNTVRDFQSKNSPVDSEHLIKALQPVTGLNDILLKPIVTTALGQLLADELLEQETTGRLRLSQKAAELTNQFSDQYEILIDQFKEQIKIDFAASEPTLATKELEHIADTIFDTLIDIFAERAIEIIATLTEEKPRIQRPARLFRVISQRAATLTPQHIGYEVIKYVTRLLTEPKGVSEQLLGYLSRAFVCANALSMDPEGNRIKREFLRERSIFIDANVLIPVLAQKSISNGFLSQVLAALRKEDIQLFTTEGFLDELYTHGSWARYMVSNHGQYSYEVYEAAIGAGHYRRNAFLDGFINYCADIGGCSFDEYLGRCVAKRGFSERYLREYVENELGINVITLKELASKRQDVYVDKTDVEDFVLQQAALREMEKSGARAGAEAEVYAIIANWDVLQPSDLAGANWRAALLSQGGFLNRVARDGPRPLEFNVVMRADAVYEFLIRLGNPTEAFSSFKEVMLSSYFHSSSYFIDMAKYKKYFGPLIAEAEDTYRRDYVQFQKYLNANLTTDYLEEFESIERPLVVKAFEQQLKQKLEGLEHKLEEEKKARAGVEKELEKYKEEERRRTEHIKKSKKRIELLAQQGKPGKRSARFGKKTKKRRR